ncbi:MAG: TolC family protein [Sphaerochaetaceae bacterium]
MKKKLFAMVWIASLLLLPAAALSLTVEDAVSYAIANNRTLESSKLDLKMDKDAKDVSWNGFLPTLQTTASLSRNNQVNPIYTVPTSPSTSFVGGVTFSFNFNPALITNMRLAQEKYLAGQISYDQAKAQTTLNVKKMFYAILLQKQALELQKQTLENTKGRMEQAQDLYSQGFATELTVLQTQVSYENLKATVLKQQQSLEQQLGTFAFLLGLDENEPLDLVGAIEPEFKNIDAQQALSRIGLRYDVITLQKQMDILDVQKKAVDQQIWIPSVALNLSYQPILSDITNNWGTSSNWYDGGSCSVTVAWNLTNLLPWSTGRQSIKTLEDNKKKLQLNLEMVQANARMEVKNLITSLSQSQEAIDSSERSINLAQKSYDMTLDAYQQGSKELLDVRDSENQLNQAKLSKLSEQYNYLSSLLDLEYALQTSL